MIDKFFNMWHTIKVATRVYEFEANLMITCYTINSKPKPPIGGFVVFMGCSSQILEREQNLNKTYTYETSCALCGFSFIRKASHARENSYTPKKSPAYESIGQVNKLHKLQSVA